MIKEKQLRIKDCYGLFCSDLNWRFHWHPACRKAPAGQWDLRVNEPTDYSNLTPEDYVNFHKSFNIDTMWIWIKHQSGHVAFPSRVAPRMEHLSSDFFKDCCQLARKAGMYVCGYTDGGDDLFAYNEHPEWFEEYGVIGACLNSPFWEREAEIVREALRVFPCDGLFYDMVHSNGSCRCEFCQKAYHEFYGRNMPGPLSPTERVRCSRYRQPLPGQKDMARFRYGTRKRWIERMTRAAREIVPSIEITLNPIYMPPDGLPSDLVKHLDWYYTETGRLGWTGEIMRAWGDKPVFAGNSIEPRTIAHLLGRRMMPAVYDTFVDHRTGKCVSTKDRRIIPIARSFDEVKQRKPFIKDSVAIPHATVLFSAENEWPNPPAVTPDYMWMVAGWIEGITRMGLSCTNVEIVEKLKPGSLAPYEIVFAPELVWFDPKSLAYLKDWVAKGCILVATGNIALKNKDGVPLEDFTDEGLLGVRKMEGPVVTFSVLTDFLAGKESLEMRDLVPVTDAFVCKSTGAEPVAYGSVGAEDHVPLIWRNKVGKGFVFYIAGSVELKTGTAEEIEWRQCLQKLLYPCIKRAPFKTTMEYPAEVWLNEQPNENRLVLHVVAYDGTLSKQQLAIRADLMAGDEMEIVYPAPSSTIIKGKRENGYVAFSMPDLSEHIIAVLKKA